MRHDPSPVRSRRTRPNRPDVNPMRKRDQERAYATGSGGGSTAGGSPGGGASSRGSGRRCSRSRGSAAPWAYDGDLERPVLGPPPSASGAAARTRPVPAAARIRAWRLRRAVVLTGRAESEIRRAHADSQVGALCDHRPAGVRGGRRSRAGAWQRPPRIEAAASSCNRGTPDLGRLRDPRGAHGRGQC